MWAWGGPVNRTHLRIQGRNFSCNFGAGALTSLKRRSSRVGCGRKDAENSPRGAVFCRLIAGTVINRRFSQRISSVLEAEAYLSEVYLTGPFRTPNSPQASTASWVVQNDDYKSLCKPKTCAYFTRATNRFYVCPRDNSIRYQLLHSAVRTGWTDI